ncbi:hypothetical protein G6F52_013199 [Rhizopus delemar]|nr:hypothetical protein G6F52_013199 [Rhizopus delemar]
MLKPFNNRTRAPIVGNHIGNGPSSTNTVITYDQGVQNIGQIAGDTVSSIQTESLRILHTNLLIWRDKSTCKQRGVLRVRQPPILYRPKTKFEAVAESRANDP